MKTQEILARKNLQQPKTADAAVQTEIPEREYISLKQLSLMQTESKAFPQILYHQHTILQLVLLLVLLFVAANYYVEPQGPNSLMDNAKTGVIFVMISMVVYFVIYLPNTIVLRPHPGLWRMLQALGTCWLGAVVFALFFNRDDLLTFFNSFVDPTLGVQIKELDFSEDCDIYTPNNPKGNFANFVDKLDVFFVAHFVGWLVKMFICRNVMMCMIQSVLFEFIEITFRHWLPNFYECWWDSIILDVVLCNTGGILAGWWLMKVFKMKEYKWSLAKEETKTSYFDNLKQLFLSPDLEKHEWKVFSSSFRFASVIFFMIVMNMIDLSFFFNKYVLWIRPTHPILSFRTFMIGFLCIPAVREYFEYVSNPLQKRLGGTCWLTMAIVFVEFFIFFKNQNGQFTEPFPTYVIIIWAIIVAAILAIFFCLLFKDIRKKFFQQPELAKLHGQ